MRICLFISLFFVSAFVFGQTPEIDSLKLCLKKPVKHDSIRALQYSDLAWYYLDISLDTSRMYNQKSIQIAKRINFRNGILACKNIDGILYRIETKYDKAAAVYNEIIELRKEWDSEDEVYIAYTNLASVYFESLEYGKAVSYYSLALKNIPENQLEQKVQIITNLAVTYSNLKMYDKSIENFTTAIKYNKKLKSDRLGLNIYTNLATVYQDKGLTDLAIKYQKVAEDYSIKLKNYRNLTTIYFNLVYCLIKKNQFKEATNYVKLFHNCARILNEDNIWSSYYYTYSRLSNAMNQNDLAKKQAQIALNYCSEDNAFMKRVILLKLVTVYIDLKDHKKALSILNELNNSKKYDLHENLELFELYYELYKDSKEYSLALKYLEKSNEIKEKINKADISNQLAVMNTLYDLESKEKDLKLSKVKNAQIKADSDRKSTLIYGMIFVGFLVLILLVISVRSNRAKRRANTKLNLQKVEIELQKQQIEEKQSEILDSIHYAKRIQDSLLIREGELKNAFPNSFVLFKPKDIVSGDFYWSTKTKDHIYIAICDSTGHGVPGAFMSALNMTFLNEAINQLHIQEPGTIFNHVRKRLIETISKDGAKDGMDGVLLCFNIENRSLTYATAINGPVIIRNNEVLKFPIDKMPVGYSDSMESFTTYSLEYQKDDVLYISTDGYMDQFGGSFEKKLKSANFYRMLAEKSFEHPDQIKQELDDYFVEWIGNLEQIDDVCVFGMKL